MGFAVVDPEGSFPLLVMAAGADKVAHPALPLEFYERAGSPDKTLISYPDHYHENFNEVDRQRVYADLEAWLATRGVGAGPKGSPTG